VLGNLFYREFEFNWYKKMIIGDSYLEGGKRGNSYRRKKGHLKVQLVDEQW
ncbi:hypothetical protein THOM_2065, partial [Trachipleistophora hominis]